MIIVVNGREHDLVGPPTVSGLVGHLGCGTQGVAIAVNDVIVPRSSWSGRALGAGDRVEVLRAVQGG